MLKVHYSSLYNFGVISLSIYSKTPIMRPPVGLDQSGRFSGVVSIMSFNKEFLTSLRQRRLSHTCTCHFNCLIWVHSLCIMKGNALNSALFN